MPSTSQGSHGTGEALQMALFRRRTARPGSGDGCVAAGHAKVTLKGSLLLSEVSPAEVLRPHNLGVPFHSSKQKNPGPLGTGPASSGSPRKRIAL